MTIDTDDLSFAACRDFFRTILRNFIFGENAGLDDSGALSARTLTANSDLWAGDRVILRPRLVEELPVPPAPPKPAVNCLGVFLISDALNPEAGSVLVGGGNRPALVSFDTRDWRVL